MDIKFSKDADESQPAGDNKGRQNVLLVVLLLLVGGFAYIYFFTGLIKPMPEQKAAEAPAAPQVVKNPLPAPDGAPAKPAAVTDGAKKEAVATAVPATPAQPAVPAAAPVAAPAKPAPPAAVKPKVEPKVVEEAHPAVKKALPGAAKAAVKKPAPLEKKPPVVAEAKPQTAKGAEKKPAAVTKPVEKQAAVADVKAKKTSQKPLKKEAAASGKWTVQVGNYVLEETMATDLARIRKAGLEAYVLPGGLKKNHMHRLLLAEFTDRETAQAELAKLKRQTADAFMIDAGGMHVVYAGSYLLDSRAASEKARLAAAGFKLTVKRAEVAIPSKNLTAGSFAEKSAAEAVLKKLRAAKVKATLIQQ